MFDPYYDLASLILPMEGANDSTTFTDFSLSPKTVTVNGNAKIIAAQSKWGQGSGYFDGSGDYLSVASDKGFGFSNKDFTVGFWMCPMRNAGDEVVLDTRPLNAGYALLIGKSSTGAVRCYDGTTVRTGGSMTLNTFCYIEWCRKNDVNYIFLDGYLVINFTDAFDAGNSRGLIIGANVSTGYENYQGYLQDLYVLPGIALHTDAFTPPVARWRPASIGGTAVVSGNGGADQVVVRDVATRKLAAIATPNASTGVWTADVQEGDYDISYFASGCQPICHGPYTVTA